MTPYLQALTDAMTRLAQEPGAIFIGQAVRYEGTGMFQTLAGVPDEKKIEFPVAENMQLGVSAGLALAGTHPVISIFPRINFLLEATSQLVSHLDKLPLYAGVTPRVIIRTAVATDSLMNPGPQHLGNYAVALEQMLSTVRIWRLCSPQDVTKGYVEAAKVNHSTILVEYHALYGT